jgi:hypothetical protein
MKSAAIDIGSARTKIMIAEKLSNGGYDFSSSAIDTALSGLIADNNLKAAEQKIVEVVETIYQKISDENIGNYLFTGTQIFREKPELATGVLAITDRFKVLSPEEEAIFFYKGIELEEKLQPNEYWALDIGGGSIQLIWSPEAGDCISLPLGTYALEKKFQSDMTKAIGFSHPEWQQMISTLKQDFKDTSFEHSKNKTLIIGSNIMGDFFESALGKRSFQLEDINQLAHQIDGKPYPELYPLFPANHGFMHGSDKLLAVIAAVLSLGNFKEATATNGSLSKSLCQLLIDNPEVIRI